MKAAGPSVVFLEGTNVPAEAAIRDRSRIGCKQESIVVVQRVNAFGGSERHTLGLISHLLASGWRVTLIESGLDLLSRRLETGNESLEVMRTTLPVRGVTASQYRDWGALFAQVPSERALFVKTWYYAGDLLFLKALRRGFHRVWHIEHWLTPEMPKRSSRLHFGFVPGVALWWYREMWNRWRMGRMADRVITVSQIARQSILRNTFLKEGRVYACRNGVDVQRWQRDSSAAVEFRRRYGIPEKAYLFGCVGRLSPEKGFDLAIRAFECLLSHEQQDARLCIVGAGHEADTLKSLSDVRVLVKRVHFVGELQDVRPAYSAFDSLLVPSLTESFLPLAALEAMACGCRVIAAPVGGIPEGLCDPDVGDLVASRCPEEWMSVMRTHLRASEEDRVRISARVRQFVVDHHDQENALGRIQEVLL